MSEYERENRDLAYEPEAQEVGSDYGTRGEKSPEQIEREIEATRERMTRDIDELGERLSPDNLKRQAKEAITNKARSTGFRMMDFIQENTSLVAAMGLGAVWLIQQRNRSEISGDRMARFAYTGPERRGNGFTRRLADRAGDAGGPVGRLVRGRAGLCCWRDFGAFHAALVANGLVTELGRPEAPRRPPEDWAPVLLARIGELVDPTPTGQG
jgi:hypothetical protein